MRILSITAQKPHSTGSGVYLTELVRALCSLGHTQAVVAGVYAEDTAAFPSGVDFYPVYFHTEALPFNIAGMSNEMPYESTVYRTMTPETTKRFRAAFTERIGEAIDEFDPDLIICHHLYLLTAIVREAFPEQKIFGFCHGTDLRQMKKNPLWQDIIPSQIRCLDRIFCLHRDQKEDICACYGVPPEKVVVAGNGYNSGIFRRLEGIAPHSGFRIAFAGKISEKKGLFSLLRALSYLPYGKDELRVSLAGGYANADYQTALDLIAQCPYEVELLGNIPQESLARMLNESDLFVLPSFYDGLPLVLAEAMACGAKVICTDLPGIRDWMNEHVPDNGIRFIAPPPMIDADTPLPESLCAFEEALAALIRESLEDTAVHHPQLAEVSWQSVGRKVISAAEQ